MLETLIQYLYKDYIRVCTNWPDIHVTKLEEARCSVSVLDLGAHSSSDGNTASRTSWVSVGDPFNGESVDHNFGNLWGGGGGGGGEGKIELRRVVGSDVPLKQCAPSIEVLMMAPLAAR